MIKKKQKIFTIILVIMYSILLTSISSARPLIADLSKRTIEIDSNFTGTKILVFGITKILGNIAIVVRGPESSYVLRKKQKIFGMWLNNKQAQFNNSLSFYKLITSNGFYNDDHSQNILKSFKIGLKNIDFDITISSGEDSNIIKKAFLDKQIKNNLYSLDQENTFFSEDNLFQAAISFPENIPRGMYTVEIYLFNNNTLLSFQFIPLNVYNVGIDAFIFNFAYSKPLIYGILSVIFAIIIGWVVGNLFSRKQL